MQQIHVEVLIFLINALDITTLFKTTVEALDKHRYDTTSPHYTQKKLAAKGCGVWQHTVQTKRNVALTRECAFARASIVAN